MQVNNSLCRVKSQLIVRRIVQIFLFILCLGNACYAYSISDFNDPVIADSILKKSYPACIKLHGIDSLTRAQNSSQFSAVVVTPEGHILTVAHATKPGNLYWVLFPDGSEGTARALGRLVTDKSTNLPDVAMMKMEGQGPWPYAEMGWSSSLAEKQLCFGWSYPESLMLNKPFLRIGQVVKPLDSYGFVVSSCIMEPGDSGGPLFDALGRVVALHSRINGPEGLNFEVPVDMYRQYWSALQVMEELEEHPKNKEDLGIDSLVTKLHAQSTLATKRKMIKTKSSSAVITISSLLNDDTVSIVGTGFALGKRKQIILSKSSSVGQRPVAKLGNKSYTLKVLARDKKNDLIALALPKRLSGAITLADIVEAPFSDDNLGEPIASVLPEEGFKYGILGMSPLSLPARFSTGSLGARLQEINGLPTVLQLDSLGPAERLGLQKDDQIITVDDKDVASAEKINRELAHYFPGDTIKVSWIREQDTLSGSLVLATRMMREGNHPANHFKGGKSVRRDGFDRVFVHDSRIHAYECGSPVLNQEGKVVGLNIARYSHTASLAIPADVLLVFLKNEELE